MFLAWTAELRQNAEAAYVKNPRAKRLRPRRPHAADQGESETMPSISGDFFYYGIIALTAFHLALGLAAAGIPCIAGVGGFAISKRSKIFQNKFGQQAGTFALLAGGYIFLVLAAAAVSLTLRLPEVAVFWFSTPLPLVPLAVSLFFGAAFFLLYRGLWQKMKDRKRIHAAIGIASAVSLWFFMYCAAASFRLFTLRLDLPDEILLFFFPGHDSSFWAVTAQALCLSASLAGAFSAVYLLLRRNKDDFGRDYYNATLRQASRWAFFAGIPQILCAAWLISALWPSMEHIGGLGAVEWPLAASAVLGLAACALWGVVSFQANALRFKLMIAGAWLCSIGSLAFQCAALAPFYLT
jgi:hypothetical protein